MKIEDKMSHPHEASMGQARLLTEATNYAVVQLPGRRFPGVVFQGDSLDGLIGDLEEVATEPDSPEQKAALSDIIDRLRAVQTRYE
jgi:hypothetical protein